MPAPQIILDLIERFERNENAYKSGVYNETQVRREFIDPFFEALGWDINNISGNAEAYKDVIHEDAVKVSGVTKAPDYSFRIGGQRKFFVEAKKPSVNVKDAPAAAFQVRRYAWSAKLPLSIVTDFEELAVYDCRMKPDQTDKSDKARTKYYTYRQYAEKWDEIAAIFSKDAILKGSFDKYAESNKAKRGTAEVDSAFLAEIESWREMLARNIALRNSVSVRELNDSVQRIIDRIIFLRIAEDRGIEDYGALRSIGNGNNTYGRLQELFYKADDRYNSGLFHFRPEKEETEPPDRLTPDLVIDDKPLKDILKTLYYPDSPYEFAVLPADILGQVYEQFLGKVIRMTSDHRAVVEDKPEVKKAGGVFYTPTYIVEYIVKNTVGKLLDDETPKKAESLRILDPACGSGSFLLGAYQYLLDWHLKYYTANNPEKHAREKRPALYSGQGGAWHLTTAERKRILLNNIYGVDIDSQAVEVTKLSLLLKVLEDETGETLNSQRKLFHERALPNLGGNIKCGNSLIGPDFYDGKQMNLLDPEEAQRVNVFDWQAEYPDIFKAGGFDAVIGNPPYLYSAGKAYSEYMNKNYQLSEYQTDYYVYFIEKALTLSRKNGQFAFIVSDSWLNSQSISRLRNDLLTSHRIESLAVFDYPVFEQAAMENSIVNILVSASPSPIPIIRFTDSRHYAVVNRLDPKSALAKGLIDPKSSAETDNVIAKLEKGSKTLNTFVCLNRGIHAYRTDGYGQSKFQSGPQTEKDKELQSYHADKLLDQTYLPEIKGRDVFRYSFVPTGRFLSYGNWLAEPRKPEFFFQPKITIRKILGERLCGTFIEEPTAIDQSLYIIISDNRDTKFLLHVLGIMLSSIGAWYLRTKFSIYDKLYPWYTKKQLAAFPMKDEDELIVQLVEQIMTLHKQLPEARTGQEQTLIQRQIDATDRQIDKLVYELYELTPEEIAIVEGR